jgi:uncharacterized protein (DUF302 family)
LPFAYRVQTGKSVSSARASVLAAITRHRFMALWQHDMGATLASKGYPGYGHLHVIEVCNAQRANEFLTLNPDGAYFLPCRILVRESGDGSEIGVLRPERLFGLAGDGAAVGPMAELASDVEGELRAIIDDAAS